MESHSLGDRVSMTRPASKAGVRAYSRRRKLRLAFAAAVALPGITMGFLAARDALAAARVADPARVAHAAVAALVDDPITGQFSRFALNALLVPLIDDHEPPIWTDVGMRFFCGPATSVEVNGRPLVPGASMPATAFTVRWHIDQCRPLARASFELSGDVEVLVFHEDDGLSAVVNAQRLKVSTSKGSSHVGTPFAASMLFGATPEVPAPLTAP
jgi:hypothetical protein